MPRTIRSIGRGGKGSLGGIGSGWLSKLVSQIKPIVERKVTNLLRQDIMTQGRRVGGSFEGKTLGKGLKWRAPIKPPGGGGGSSPSPGSGTKGGMQPFKGRGTDTGPGGNAAINAQLARGGGGSGGLGGNATIDAQFARGGGTGGTPIFVPASGTGTAGGKGLGSFTMGKQGNITGTAFTQEEQQAIQNVFGGFESMFGL